jgi:hypothetical protein
MMEDVTEKLQDQAGLFARLWTDFAGKMAMSGLSFTPGAAPPEAARQVRGAMFDGMTKYFDEYMRSPQFLESMKQSLDASMAFRKQFQDFFTQMHHEAQSPAREDIDSVMLTMRHVETRLLDRLDELSARVEEIAARLPRSNGGKRGGRRESVEPEASAEGQGG